MRVRASPLDEVGDAEVGELREADAGRRLGHHHHVLGLQVAVDDPARVRVGERVAQIRADPRHVAVRDRAGPQQLRKGSAPNELRHQVDVVLVGGQLVDADDRGMVQAGGRERLALDALSAPALERDRLDRHLALEALVPGVPDDAEAARAEALLEAVATEHQTRARGARQAFGRVRPSQRHGAGLLGQACLGTSHSRFCVRSAESASCPPFILQSKRCVRLEALGAILLSFLDEPDEPVGGRSRRRPPGGGRSTDRQTLMVRRTLAIGAGLLVLILLVLAFRGCLNARNEQSIKDYVSESSELIDQSKLEGEQLFDLLGGSGDQDDAVDSANVVNGCGASRRRSSTAPTTSTCPTRSRPPRTTCSSRSSCAATGSRPSPNALPGRARRRGAPREHRRHRRDDAGLPGERRAAQVPLPAEPSAGARGRGPDRRGERAEGGQLEFVPDVQWVDPDFVADQIAGLRGGGDATGDDESAAPGLHGNGLGTVTLGGVALVPGASATVPLSDDLSFEVQVLNQGENTETDVNVKVTVGEGNDATELEETIPEIAVGEQQTVTIPLAEQPPTGENVPVTVEVEPVAGEEKTDNNSGEFTVIFTS